MLFRSISINKVGYLDILSYVFALELG